MTLAVVIPAYNEAVGIGTVLQSLPKKVYHYRVLPIVVDDGSKDNTSQVARDHNARVIRHIINRGQGAALKTGIEYAVANGADVIVTFDADGQHHPEEIPRMIKPILDGEVEAVLGSRFLSQHPENLPPVRKAILKAGVLFTRLISRIRVTDTHNGFRAFHVSAIKRMNLVQDKMEHASEILDQISIHRIPYKEVPVTITYSNYSMVKGQSNLNSVKIAAKMLFYKLK